MDLAEKCYSDLLDELEGDRLTLPTLPETALRVRETMASEDVAPAEIAGLINTDPALTARLLKVVNSPMYRGSRMIENVQQAVTRLGVKLVRNLVLGLCLKQLFEPKSPVTAQRFKHLWDHSTHVASISHVLARQFTELAPEQAMLGGLLHDIGTVPILVYAERNPQLAADAAVLERAIFGLHARVGKAILEAWRFAPELIAVVSEHENLSRNPGPKPDYVDVVIVANLQSYVGSNHPLARVNLAEVPAYAKLGLDTDVSVINMEGAVENVAEIQSALSA